MQKMDWESKSGIIIIYVRWESQHDEAQREHMLYVEGENHTFSLLLHVCLFCFNTTLSIKKYFWASS